MAGPHPEQQGARAPVCQRLPALVEAAQQIVQALAPKLQPQELRRATVRVRAQPVEKNLRADALLRIDRNPEMGTQSSFEKGCRLVPIELSE